LIDGKTRSAKLVAVLLPAHRCAKTPAPKHEEFRSELALADAGTASASATEASINDRVIDTPRL
jgi:hypothetical protein